MSAQVIICDCISELIAGPLCTSIYQPLAGIPPVTPAMVVSTLAKPIALALMSVKAYTTFPALLHDPAEIRAGWVLLGARPVKARWTINLCVPGSHMSCTVPEGVCFMTAVAAVTTVAVAVALVFDVSLVPHAARKTVAIPANRATWTMLRFEKYFVRIETPLP